MSIFRNDVSSNYFIDGTCSESAFFDTIDNTIMLVDEASEIVNEKSFGEVVKDIKDGIVKLFNKFIETIKGLWQKFIDSITKFFEDHNLGTLVGGHLEKSLDNISDDTINKANEILSKSKVWSTHEGYIPVPQDIYKLVNTDFSKLLLDANKVIGDETLISALSSASDKISDDLWKIIADSLASDIAKGNAQEAFCDAIGKCGELLKEHYPSEKENENELPDGLVILEN